MLTTRHAGESKSLSALLIVPEVTANLPYATKLEVFMSSRIGATDLGAHGKPAIIYPDTPCITLRQPKSAACS